MDVLKTTEHRSGAQAIALSGMASPGLLIFVYTREGGRLLTEQRQMDKTVPALHMTRLTWECPVTDEYAVVVSGPEDDLEQPWQRPAISVTEATYTVRVQRSSGVPSRGRVCH
jgi:hypothetical protein